MKWIDMIFILILVWTVISTTLLIQQFNNNHILQQKLKDTKQHQHKRHKSSRRMNLVNKFNNKIQQDDAARLEKVQRREEQKKIHEYQLRSNIPMSANQFPFTRSIERFTRSSQFFIYVVNKNQLDDSLPLQWSEVRWKELVLNWNQETTFDTLLGMTTPLHDKKNIKLPSFEEEGIMSKKFVLHCLPKAASTTLRRACYAHQKESCPEIEFPQQQDPFGYRKVDDFFTAVKKCKDINHFCVQGGDANMSIINYKGADKDDMKEGEDNKDGTPKDDNWVNTSKEEGEEADNIITPTKEERDDMKDDNLDREPFHFIHMVPFRNYNDWVESAIKQIYTIDGSCNRIDRLLDEGCFGYRELYFELYPKIVLSMLTGMAFDANGNHEDVQSKDKHHILLYNYVDVSTIVTRVSDYFDIEPMPGTNSRKKEVRAEGTCPSEISEKFHTCYDETLMTKSDAIRNLEMESKRRNDQARKFKTLLARIKKAEDEQKGLES